MNDSRTRHGRSACLTGVAMAACLAAGAVGIDDNSRTWTTDADFDEGVLLNVNHDAPNNDQLQLNETTRPFPFINVAASSRGTVIRIDTETGEILGEYRSAPEGRGLNPSRTTVDLFGNVWISNRNEEGQIGGVPHGSVVKIGLVVGGTRVDADGTPNPNGQYLAPPFIYNTCVDRDGDGLIKTSNGLGNILDWPDITDGVGGVTALVEDADDECILIFQRLPDAPNARHVSVDPDNNVWVGGYPFAQRMFHKLDDDTGMILDSFDARDFGCGGYGGLMDGNEVIWSASISQNKLLRYDVLTHTGSCIDITTSYGLGIDTNGYIWNAMWTANTIAKISPAGVIQPGFPVPTGGTDSRGVAITPVDNDVWVANSTSNDVSRLDNDGVLLKVIPVGTTPTGVAVDANGKVWVTNLGSDNVMRIDPNGGGDGLGAVDLTVDLGPGSGPYNYSDMTGIVVLDAVRTGSWSAIFEAPALDWPDMTIFWNGAEPAGTALDVETRAANTIPGLGGQPWTDVVNDEAIEGLSGQYWEIRVSFSRDTGVDVSPVLYDLTAVAGPDCNENGIPDVDELEPDCDPALAEPRDTCELAMCVGPDILYEHDTFGATAQGALWCDLMFGIYDVWYWYRPAWTGLAFLRVEGPPTDFVYAVYEGCPATAMNYIDCNTTRHFEIVWLAEKGKTYYFRVAATYFQRAPFEMNMVGPPVSLTPLDNNFNEIIDDCECLADVNFDGVVDMTDASLVLAAWGPCPGCPEDVDGNGVVNEYDYYEVFDNLGPCPFGNDPPHPTRTPGTGQN